MSTTTAKGLGVKLQRLDLEIATAMKNAPDDAGIGAEDQRANTRIHRLCQLRQ